MRILTLPRIRQQAAGTTGEYEVLVHQNLTAAAVVAAVDAVAADVVAAAGVDAFATADVVAAVARVAARVAGLVAGGAAGLVVGRRRALFFFLSLSLSSPSCIWRPANAANPHTLLSLGRSSHTTHLPTLLA